MDDLTPMPPSIDRLSDLPDDVICHILSFLPTKTSVSTNVLAKRWRFMWAQVPSLDFHGIDFEESEIINKVIELHRAKTINTLSLSGDMEYSPDELPSWITHAVNRGVRNLYLEIYFNVDFTLQPNCLLTCKTLVDVKLHGIREGIPSTGKVFLPSLKKLHLSHVVFDDDESLPHMLSGCPILQDLIMAGCYAPSCVSISSLTVKTLDVQCQCECCDGISFELIINIPSLEYLNVRNYDLEDVVIMRTMTSLIEADLDLIGELVWGHEEDIEEYYTAVEFLHCLCNVKCLKISIRRVEKLIKIAGLDSTVKFHNLTKLEIDSLFDFHELVKFLGAADNLQLLTFTLNGKYNTYREPKQVPSCMLSCLKTVRINSSHDLNANDFKTIRYVLKNVQLLERMEIPRSMEELEMLERGSDSCQLVFY